MRAITTLPGTADSARLEEIPEPPDAPDTLLVDAIAIGVCGTDLEILSGAYGQAPPGRERLVIGHENVGRVRTAPPGSGFSPGDLVVGVVRRPDPVPCPSCAAGEWDMCKNGKFTERGITGQDGYASERYRLETAFAVAVPAALGDLAVLVEPTTILAKAWEQIERIGARATWSPVARPGDRRRADRPAGGAARPAARSRGARPRSGHLRPEAGAGRRARRHLPHAGR